MKGRYHFHGFNGLWGTFMNKALIEKKKKQTTEKKKEIISNNRNILQREEHIVPKNVSTTIFNFTQLC